MPPSVVKDYSTFGSMYYNAIPNQSRHFFERPAAELGIPGATATERALGFLIEDGVKPTWSAANTERVEQQGSTIIRPGETRWIDFWGYIDHIAPHNIGDWDIKFAQLHSSSGPPPVDVQVVGNMMRVRMHRRTAGRYITSWLYPVKKAFRLTLGVHNRGTNEGWVEPWLNGVRLGRWMGPTSDGDNLYLKRGHYRISSINGSSLIYICREKVWDGNPNDGPVTPTDPVLDTVGPTIGLRLPAPPANGAPLVLGPKVEVRADAADPSGVARVEASLVDRSGGLVKHLWTEANAPYGDTGLVSIEDVDDGDYLLRLRGTDRLGNVRVLDHPARVDLRPDVPPPGETCEQERDRLRARIAELEQGGAGG
ncbi:MAG TPA: heparin lyase I family protein [Miltoncostaeaceae bacterium]|nr:heparin lyase I family protein [Miltoncostaeaceae bacterium]